MFKNYLKVALRNLKKHKAFAFINITGLAVGMAVCILIMLYVLNELSYDKFHENSHRIYRIGVEGNLNGTFVKLPLSNLGTGPAMFKDFPEVENFCRLLGMDRIPVQYKEKSYFEKRIVFTDEHFFEMFSFLLLQGDPKSVLESTYSLVITRDMAIKYFGNEAPLGKQLRLNNQHDYTITGVMENFPQNSHLKFDMLASFKTKYAINPQIEEWNNFNNMTYFLLKEGVDPAKFAEKFSAFIDRYLATMRQLLGNEFAFFLQPITDIHLRSQMAYDMPDNSDITYIYVFVCIAIFILLLACINFMNLATARYASRSREIGMRKILGAERLNLMKQFLGESIIYSTISMIIALVVVLLVLPWFNALNNTALSLPVKDLPWLIPVFLGLTVVTGLLAGSYPAFMLSAFQPLKIIRGTQKADLGSVRFRQILVIFQFIISIVLICGTLIMMNQLSYMKNKKLGFEKERIVVIPIMDKKLVKNLDGIRSELKSYHNITYVSAASDLPGQDPDYTAYVPEGFTLEQTQLMHHINCDVNFIPALEMEIVTGRNFSEKFITDPEEAVIINQTAARTYGWENPLGKKIGHFIDNSLTNMGYRTVIGVVKDFHVKSLHEKIVPLQLTNEKDYLEEIMVKIKPENIAGTLDFLKDKWQEYDPTRPFDYNFLDQNFDAQYRSDERLNKIISYFTIFAIFVACLGLYGMASFMAEQRFKEIGIRKTLGASVPGIVLLMSREVTRLILIASFIAIPLAYHLLDQWLQNFAYRSSISIVSFISAAIAALFIGYLTIAYQSIRAALTNPVNAIRTE